MRLALGLKNENLTWDGIAVTTSSGIFLIMLSRRTSEDVLVSEVVFMIVV